MLHIKKIFGIILGLTLFISVPSFAQDLKSAIKLTESEQFEAAHKVFDALIAKEPGKPDNYYYYGECWLKQYFVDSMSVSLKEVTEPALAQYKKGIEKDTNFPLNYVGVGRVDVLLGKNAEAKKMFAKAKDKLPFKNYTNPKYIPVAKQALTYAKIAQAELMATDRNKDEMLELITKAVDRDPSVVDVYLIKGDIYLEYNDGSNAIVAYLKANELDSLSCKAMVKIGEVYVRGHTYEDALKYFKKAIEIDSFFAPAYRERAELYGLADRWEKAVKDYKKFVELSGNNTYAKYRLASFLFMAKRYDECLQVCSEVLAIDPSYVILYRLEGYSYFETGKYPEGLKAIETFFKEAKPEKIINSDYIYYGDLLSKTGSDAQGLEKYNIALKNDTSNCELLSKIIKSYQKLKDFDSAIKTFQKKANNNCLTLNDNYEMAKIYLNNGGVLWTKKDTAGAFKAWNKADTLFGTVLAKKPDFYNAINYRAKLNINMDTAYKLGTAVKWYNVLLPYALKDTAKYSKDVYTAYDYIRFYTYKQYIRSKNCDDAKKCIENCDKILALYPKDDKALETKRGLKIKCPY